MSLLTNNYSNFSASPLYIKSTADGNYACMYISSAELCLSINYWDTNLATTQTKLKTDMKNTFSLSGNPSCEGSIYVDCYVAELYDFVVFEDGKVMVYIFSNGNGTNYCVVYSDGTAYCNNGTVPFN